MNIAIIDSIGLPYNAHTLFFQGLGGSESAVIYMAEELCRQGFTVKVFNTGHEYKTRMSFNGQSLSYHHIDEVNAPGESCDILISSRSVLPFVDEKYAKLRASAKYKVLWMHDTFCEGDHLLEELVVSKKIDTIFTLSDFHTSYVTNCEHGPRRNFEVLKNHVFVTRNGVKRHIESFPMEMKDQNLFVYNASVSKGMKPLVEHIWPKVKQHLPLARLTIIGGYYQFPNKEPDQQQFEWQALKNRPDNASLDIHFTGILKQKDVAALLAKAKFTIYPAAFPETYGISTLESLTYNTPVITNRFGALEETALDMACYKMNYPIVPNSLFPHIDETQQYDKFVDLVVAAAKDNYLYEQKYSACNMIDGVCDWGAIALQWKQHFYRAMQKYLPIEEYRRVMHINHRVGEVFGRRFINPEDRVYPSKKEKTHFVVISPFYNASAYIEDCIRSVASQDYENYTHIVINDASTDNSEEKIANLLATLPASRSGKIMQMLREKNEGSVFNYVNTIKDSYIHPSSVVVMLDGDDALMPDSTIFSKLNTLYSDGTEFTYGSMWSIADNIPLIAQEYPKDVRESGAYRKHLFRWKMPYTHLRTFVARLIKDVPVSQFQINGNWMRAGGDTAIFYSAIERADPTKIVAVKDVWYRYNDKNPINDYKVNAQEQTATSNAVIQKKNKKILLAIPTAKYIEPETFQSIYELDLPDGYEMDLQFFYGYRIDQIRNLIADWSLRNDYDYLFSVDSDIVVPRDALRKMLHHDVDIVSGVYVQRNDMNIPELFVDCNSGDSTVKHMHIEEIRNASSPLMQIAACGFGCVLVKREVLEKMTYPHFVYQPALLHHQTCPEDVYFCQKATALGFRVFVDTSIKCPHKGSRWHLVP